MGNKFGSKVSNSQFHGLIIIYRTSLSSFIKKSKPLLRKRAREILKTKRTFLEGYFLKETNKINNVSKQHYSKCNGFKGHLL